VAWLVLLSGVGAHNLGPIGSVRVDHISVDLDDDVRFQASPNALKKSGEWVTVQFSGVKSPSHGDWIGVYSPADADVHHTAPIKYKFAWESAGFLHTGKGALKFRLLNMRHDYSFALFRNGTYYPVMVAQSQAVHFKNYNEPLQGHLSLTGKATEMRVVWVTRDAHKPKVLYGTRPNQCTASVHAKSTTYKRDQLCGAPATTSGWRDPGLIHSAVMTDLIPGVRYFYTYGDVYGMSEEKSFVAPLPAGARDGFSFFAFGDMGTAEEDGSLGKQLDVSSLNSSRAMELDLADHTKMILHIGDISYAKGFGAQWDSFYHQIESIASSVPWMTCPGNHESDFPHLAGVWMSGRDSGGECGVPYAARNHMPTTHSGLAWYSYDYGLVHVVMMSTEHNFEAGSAQYEFLLKDLAAVNRSLTPWIVFNGHRPMYIDSTFDGSFNSDQVVARHMRKHIEPLLVKYEVDVCFWGHHHSYQRTCQVANEQCQDPDPDQDQDQEAKHRYHGPVHIVTGASGADTSDNVRDDPPAWLRYLNFKDHGYTRAFVSSSELRLQFVTGSDRKVRDEVVLPMPANRLLD